MEPKQPTTGGLFETGNGNKRPRVGGATGAEPESAKKKKSNRKYNESYLKYGFVAAGESHAQRPLCLVCGDTLSNDALKPSKLLRHFEARHHELKNMPLEFFEQRKVLLGQEGHIQVLSVTSGKTPTKVAALRQPKKSTPKNVAALRQPKSTPKKVAAMRQPKYTPTNVAALRHSVDSESTSTNVAALIHSESTPTNVAALSALRQPESTISTSTNVAALRQSESTSTNVSALRQPESTSTNVSALRQPESTSKNVAALRQPESTSTNVAALRQSKSTPKNVSALRQSESTSKNVAALRQSESTSTHVSVLRQSAEYTSTNVVALRVGLSNLVASLIGEIEEPFTISEELILPACELIFREILGESAANNRAHVHPSEDEMAEDIEAQLLERIRASPWYAIQVDESTDVDNKAVVLVYVRYISQDDVREDLLCALSLPTNTTAAELFKALDNYMSGKLDWSFCVGLSTDGAAAMTGRLSGFTAMVKQVAPECELAHCVIHREMLASQKNSPELNSVLNDIVKMISHVKALALNSHLFEQLCGDIDTELKCLLLHTEVRWLSRGRSLARVFELRGPLQRFLSEINSPLAARFSDEEWVSKLAYLCDIFNLLNEFNLSLQGRMANVFKMSDKVAALKAKLGLWGRRVNMGSFDMFHSLAEVFGETETVPSFSQLVRDHLASLSMELERYFPTTKDPQSSKEWMRDPFVNVPGDESSLSMEEEHQLIEVANDGGLKSLFWITSSLPTFWIKVRAEHPGIATKALKTLLPFPTTSLCEAGFASMMARKTELQNRLDINNTLRVSLSRTPRLDRLVARKQAHQQPLRKENGSH